MFIQKRAKTPLLFILVPLKCPISPCFTKSSVNKINCRYYFSNKTVFVQNAAAHYDTLKDPSAADAWRGITQPTACYPYDQTMVPYPYPNT